MSSSLASMPTRAKRSPAPSAAYTIANISRCCEGGSPAMTALQVSLEYLPNHGATSVKNADGFLVRPTVTQPPEELNGGNLP